MNITADVVLSPAAMLTVITLAARGCTNVTSSNTLTTLLDWWRYVHASSSSCHRWRAVQRPPAHAGLSGLDILCFTKHSPVTTRYRAGQTRPRDCKPACRQGNWQAPGAVLRPRGTCRTPPSPVMGYTCFLVLPSRSPGDAVHCE